MKKINKKYIIVIISMLLLLIIIGFIVFINNNKYKAKKITLEAGSELSDNIEDYLNTNDNINDYKLDLSNVNPDKVGEYNYFISFNKKTIKGIIDVIDTTPPFIKTQDLYIEIGESYNLGDAVYHYEDASDEYIISYADDFDPKELLVVGDHIVKIIVTDSSGNKTDAEINIHVYENGTLNLLRTTDLEYAYYESNNENIDNIDDKYYIKFDVAKEKNEEILMESYPYYDLEDIDNYVRQKYAGFRYVNFERIIVYNKYSYIIGFLYQIEITNNSENKFIYPSKEELATFVN